MQSVSERFTVSVVNVRARTGKRLEHSRLEERRIVEYYYCYRVTVTLTTTTTTTAAVADTSNTTKKN